MPNIWSDLRIAWRSLRAKPAFTAIAVGSLALGIGANTAIFSVIESALLRGLPYRDAGRLVKVRDHQPCCDEASISPGELLDYQSQTKTLSGLAGFTGQNATLTGRGDPRRFHGIVATTNFFEVLGAHPLAGRLFSSSIDKPASGRVAVIAEKLWRSEFAADPNIVGQNLTLNGQSFRVVGILPDNQTYPSFTDFWLCPRLAVPEYVELQRANGFNIANEYGDHWLVGVGRLQPGISLSTARAELNAIAKRIASVHGMLKDHHAVIAPLHDSLVADVRPALWILLSAVVVLLLVACSNLAGLMLARASGRTRELAVRVALGATRARIVRLMLAESLLLASFSGVLGILLAQGALRLIDLYSPYELPPALAPDLNLPVVAFCIAAAFASALLSGIVPAWRSARADVNEGLKEGSKGSVSGGTRRLRKILVGSEIAVSVVLLVGACLLLRSFSKLISVDLGFNPSRITVSSVSLPSPRYAADSAKAIFWRNLLAKLSAIPGVESAAFIDNMPLSGSSSGSGIRIVGHSALSSPSMHAKEFSVSPRTFEALHIPLLAGRVFDERDNEKAPLAVVVNERFARKAFGRENPIGKQFDGGPVPGTATIVGVVGDIRHQEIRSAPEPDMFYNYPQYVPYTMELIIQTKSGASVSAFQLREIVRPLDPDLVVGEVKPFSSFVGSSLAASRFLLSLVGAFSILAVILAAVGLYAVLAYSVEQRRQEIGIRIALGAAGSQVLAMVLRECSAIAVAGLAAGLLAAAAFSSLLKSILFGVTGVDWVAYSAGAALMLAICTVASLIPALRAARIDPICALRYE